MKYLTMSQRDETVASGVRVIVQEAWSYPLHQNEVLGEGNHGFDNMLILQIIEDRLQGGFRGSDGALGAFRIERLPILREQGIGQLPTPQVAMFPSKKPAWIRVLRLYIPVGVGSFNAKESTNMLARTLFACSSSLSRLVCPTK
ncbi:MAG TPA: hypothetical protein PLV64_22410 [Anaerolineales bacterium]|nr:hypothetical protein [Anaerolineales bacterium]